MSDINNNEKEVVYMECRNNHALSIGKVGYDGCPKFLKPGGDENAEDALLCACCNCHRNFHHQHIIHKPIPQNAVLTGPTVNGGQTKQSDMMMMKPRRKKRTTYTAEEREQLMRFADSMGWKPTKENSEEINNFCTAIGMTRTEFVIWLSNNRHRARARARQNAQAPPPQN